MDLTASKNAYMLIRLVGWLVEYWLSCHPLQDCQGLTQPGLSDLIRSAEAGLERGGGGRMAMPSMLDTSNLAVEERERGVQ